MYRFTREIEAGVERAGRDGSTGFQIPYPKNGNRLSSLR